MTPKIIHPSKAVLCADCGQELDYREEMARWCCRAWRCWTCWNRHLDTELRRP